MLRSIHVFATVVSVSVLLAACGGGGGEESVGSYGTESGDTFAAAVAESSALLDEDSVSAADLPPDAVRWKIKEVLHDVGFTPETNSVGLESGGKLFGYYISETSTEKWGLNFVLGKDGIQRGTPGEYRYERILDMNKYGHILFSASQPASRPETYPAYQFTYIYRDGESIYVPAGAKQLNNAGQVAGTFVHIWKNGPFQPSQAFIYKDGVRTDIPLLPGTSWNEAVAMNNEGHVVGYTRTYMGQGNPETYRAYMYKNGKVKDLGSLPGTDQCQADDINNRDVIIGRCHDKDRGSAESNQPFIFSEGAMRKLPGIDRVDDPFFAINNRGQIVGNAQREGTAGESFPFLYSGGKAVNLNNLPGIAESGVTLHRARQINDAGQILAVRYEGGNLRYFVLTPKPSVAPAN